jgi:hypothetical protein
VEAGRADPEAINLPVLPHEHFPTAASTVTPTSEGVEIPIGWGHAGEPAR